jgi:hypothetical protein
VEDFAQGSTYADHDSLDVFPGAADPRAIEATKRLKLSRNNPLDEMMMLGCCDEVPC